MHMHESTHTYAHACRCAASAEVMAGLVPQAGTGYRLVPPAGTGYRVQGVAEMAGLIPQTARPTSRPSKRGPAGTGYRLPSGPSSAGHALYPVPSGLVSSAEWGARVCSGVVSNFSRGSHGFEAGGLSPAEVHCIHV